jgi:hypothetical protein
MREALFGYYLDCLNRHDRVKQYITNPENGYEGLTNIDIEDMSQHLFLYGTLLPSEAPKEIASLVKRFRRLGSARVRGRFYDFGEFPGAVLDPSSRTMFMGS